MSTCPGAGHCPGCNKPGGLIALAVVVFMIIGVMAERHAIDVFLTDLMIGILCFAGVLIAGGIAAVILVIRRNRKHHRELMWLEQPQQIGQPPRAIVPGQVISSESDPVKLHIWR